MAEAVNSSQFCLNLFTIIVYCREYAYDLTEVHKYMSGTKIIATFMFAMLLLPGCLSEGFGDEVVEGCMDVEAINFNENANADDYSCEYKIIEQVIEGCVTSTAINFNPEAVISDGSCLFIATGQEIDGALDEISELLSSYRDRENMHSPLVLTGVDIQMSMEIFSNNGEATMVLNMEDDRIYTAMETQGIATVCYVVISDCLQHRNNGEWGHDEYIDHIQMTISEHFRTSDVDGERFDFFNLPNAYYHLMNIEIPAGGTWAVEVDNSNMAYQIATITGLGDSGEISLSAIFTIGSVELISLSVSTWDVAYTLNVGIMPSSIDLPSDVEKMPVFIDLLPQEIEMIGPSFVYVWECAVNLVNLDSLEDESVDSVNEVLYSWNIAFPTFCGELVENDIENSSFTNMGPVFDNRWGLVTWIEDPDTLEYEEVILEIDIDGTTYTMYLLDVTSHECTHNGGTYDVFTQTCEYRTENINTDVSNNYICQEDEYYGEGCYRYGISEEGHLFYGYEYEIEDGGEQDGGENIENDTEMIWECRDSVFAEDNTPLGPDSEEEVENMISNMSEPDWCGEEIAWNGTFSSDLPSEEEIIEKNWMQGAMYLDFENTGTLNFGDRDMEQDECNENGGMWNSIEEACEMEMAEWIANETLIELDWGWGEVQRLRYEHVEGGIVIAFSEENGTMDGVPDMINTFVEGYEETGYDSFEYLASENGTHIIQSIQDGDGFLYLYSTSFDPDLPEQNAIAAQDDWYIEDDYGSAIHWNLTAGMTYFIVTTTYESGEEMIFNNTVLTPGENVISWNGVIDSQSPVFIRSDGWWEEEVENGAGYEMSVLTYVADSHWNEVSTGELEINVYSGNWLIGTITISDGFGILSDGTEVEYYDYDGDNLLSAGDMIAITGNDWDGYWFTIWDTWAEDFAFGTI